MSAPRVYTYLVFAFSLVLLDHLREGIDLALVILVALRWPLGEWKLAVCLLALLVEHVVEGVQR